MDHEALARALRDSVALLEVSARSLPLANLQVEMSDGAIKLNFCHGGQHFTYSDNEGLVAISVTLKGNEPGVLQTRLHRATVTDGPACDYTFINTTTNHNFRLYWLDCSGHRHSYGTVKAGDEHRQSTYAGHVWLFRGSGWQGTVETPEGGGSIVLDDTFIQNATSASNATESGGDSDSASDDSASDDSSSASESDEEDAHCVSPDGTWICWLHEYNVWLRREDDDGVGAALTSDGREGDAYVSLQWDHTSRFVLATRVQHPKDPPRMLNLVDSWPKRSSHEPKLVQKRYLKPGDPLPVPRLVVLVPVEGKRIDVAEALFEQPFTEDGILDVVTIPGSLALPGFVVDFVSRSKQLRRMVAIDGATGTARVVFQDNCLEEDHQAAFIDTTCGKCWTNWMDVGPVHGNVLLLSERSGFCHLYAVNVKAAGSASQPRQITGGEWNVLEVVKVDQEGGVVWFMAGGIVAGQDPYYRHLCRVSVLPPHDEGALQDPTVLTAEGHGTHEVTICDSGRYFIDTWSRVDLPPRVQLRCAEEGKVLLEVEIADAAALLATGWSMPERFCSKGADGSTLIYGILVHPAPEHREQASACPVVEEIYAGPHDFHCPKKWSSLERLQHFAHFGCVAVFCDGVGTNARGRQFLDHCWQNVAGVGLDDHRAFIQAAASTRQWMNINRVGIFGGSAGGQSAFRALLDHGDFYRVAVADCGCHDNRVDKIWWNEQWFGYPVGPHYEENSNVAHAAKLGDHHRLMLIVGELDRNVDPASTLQLAGALQRAGKDFELVVMVGEGHGCAETPYGSRKRLGFLLRHLGCGVGLDGAYAAENA